MAIKLIAIDMDGTLLNSDHKVTERVKESIHYAKSKGVQVILATGRPFSGISPYLLELGLNSEQDFCISNNGSYIHHAHTGEITAKETITFDDYRAIEALSRELGVCMHTHIDSCIYTSNEKISRYTVIESYLSNTQLVYRALDKMSPDEPYIKCVFSDQPSLLDEVEGQIPEDFRQRFNVVKSATFYLEFLSKKASKGNALQKVAKSLSIQPSEMMCMGDQENDFSMFAVAETKVAMGNGIKLLKDNATFITTTNNEHGVAIAIEKFV